MALNTLICLLFFGFLFGSVPVVNSIGCANPTGEVPFVEGSITGCPGVFSGGIAAGASLCDTANGWSLCQSTEEVLALGLDSATCGSTAPNGHWYASAQSGPGNGVCSPTGSNDIWGCGTGTTLVKIFDSSCNPFTDSIRHNVLTAGWDTPDSDGFDEKETLESLGTHGGVLCCRLWRTCKHVYEWGGHKSSGVYPLVLDRGITDVYCRFDEIGCLAWTLIESFSWANKHPYEQKAFLQDFAVNADDPSFRTTTYRWARSDMLDYIQRSKYFLASCDLDTSQTLDYAWGLISDWNILTYSGQGVCQNVLAINIRGSSCTNCQAPFWQRTDIEHLHVDSQANLCGVPPWYITAVASEDAWGLYYAPNVAFTCTATSTSTTNWWFGDDLDNNAKGGQDPEYKSLDGLSFNYDGPCSYMISTNKCGSLEKYPLFEIISHHGKPSASELHVIAIKQITVRIWKDFYSPQFIVLKSKNRITINGKKMKLPYHDDYVSINKIQEMVGHQHVKRIQFKTSFGLNLLWTNQAAGSFELTIPKKYKTCGLLGNNNGNKLDDLTMRNGTILSYKLPLNEKNPQVMIMGDSWMIPIPNQPLRCDLYPHSSSKSTHQCSFDLSSVEKACNNMLTEQFHKLGGEFVAKCFRSSSKEYNGIDKTRIYDDCITEICSCHGKKHCIPQIAIKEFQQVCQHNNVSFPHITWNS